MILSLFWTLDFGLWTLDSQAAGAGTVPGMQFLLLGKNWRSFGMGDTYAALSDDSGAFFGNPAGAGFLKNTTLQMGGMTSDLLGEDGSFQFSWIYPRKRAPSAWALFAEGMSVSAEAYDVTGTPLSGKLATDENTAYGFGYARRLGARWGIGFLFRQANETINKEKINDLPSYEAEGTTIGLGLLRVSENERWRAGTSLYHLGSEVQYKTSGASSSGVTITTAPLPSGARLGLAASFLNENALTLAYDFDLPRNMSDRSHHVGIEWKLLKPLTFRTGLSFNGDGRRDIHFGVGLSFGGFVFDMGSRNNLGAAGPGSSFGLNLAWYFSRSEHYERGDGQHPEKAPSQPSAMPSETPLPPVIEQIPEAPAFQGIKIAVPAGRKLQVAVVDFEGRGLSDLEVGALTDFFRSGLVNTNAFLIVDRGNMDKILTEQKFQQTGCTTQE
ncbi:MAG: hypothetical protein HY547_08680, partial [Elusimicrobia bacterium]|nr:hypothetical protein [Elusimicrobiota bacterium]